MDADEYQKQALRTEVTPEFISSDFMAIRRARGTDGGLSSYQLSRLLHGLIGLCTEAGEAQDNVKKALVYGKLFDRINIKEEIGDIFWYCALALDAAGFTMEEAMQANIDKLKKRYAEKFSPEQALNRDLSAEREALERCVPRYPKPGEESTD